MDRYYSRFKRGDVWWVYFPRETGDGIQDSSVQKKSRPYLIVSCEENNNHAMVLQMIPLTTRDNDHLPMHVYFRYDNGPADSRNQLILCEQLTTISVTLLNNPKSYYMYSLNSEFMLKVDDTLARQLGLRPRVADMTVLERIVSDLAKEEKRKIDEQKEKEIQMRVEKLAVALAKKFNIELSAKDFLNDSEYRDEELQLADKETVAEMRKTAAERKTPPASAPSSTPCKPEVALKPTSATSGKVNSPSRTNTRWNDDKKRAFVNDYKSLSIEAMAEKYQMTKSSIQSTASKFRRELL